MMSGVCGTLTVPLLYGFAKRLFSSTAAAATAVFLLVTSGYFYVQARIATPEIFVAFFALLTIYCGYRFWLSGQIVPRRKSNVYPDGTRIDGDFVAYPSGERRALTATALVEGDTSTVWRPHGVEITMPGASLKWNADRTIAGTVENLPVFDRQRWAAWLLLTALAAACVITSKWDGLFDLAALWAVAALVSAQRFWPAWRAIAKAAKKAAPLRFVWGNPYGWRLPIFVAASIAVLAVVYLLAYVPYFSQGGGHNWHDLVALQSYMFNYHYTLQATHPYSSKWWTWPLTLRPVSYYYHSFSPAASTNQIVAEILALPNPAVWYAGLITVPLAGWFAWRERHKGIALCISAYLLQWLPWSASPRIDFQYNFYSNLAIICICTTYVLQKAWKHAAGLTKDSALPPWAVKALIFAYLADCAALFVYFFPILSGAHIAWAAWHARMWLPWGAPYGWI